MCYYSFYTIKKITIFRLNLSDQIIFYIRKWIPYAIAIPFFAIHEPKFADLERLFAKLTETRKEIGAVLPFSGDQFVRQWIEPHSSKSTGCLFNS